MWNRDPRAITAKYAGKCADCNEPFNRGERVFYYPANRIAVSGKCAEIAKRLWEAEAWDEENFAAAYNRGEFKI